VIPFPVTFTEELSRYLMIWTALLAVSCGIARREHIGLVLLFDKFPAEYRKSIALIFDVISFCFFAFIFVYGIGFVERGFNSITMIYAMPKAYPYLIVPISAFLACTQLALLAFSDIYARDVVVSARQAEA